MFLQKRPLAKAGMLKMDRNPTAEALARNLYGGGPTGRPRAIKDQGLNLSNLLCPAAMMWPPGLLIIQ